jgi:hypothetical protein
MLPSCPIIASGDFSFQKTSKIIYVFWGSAPFSVVVEYSVLIQVSVNFIFKSVSFKLLGLKTFSREH